MFDSLIRKCWVITYTTLYFYIWLPSRFKVLLRILILFTFLGEEIGGAIDNHMVENGGGLEDKALRFKLVKKRLVSYVRCLKV